MGTLSLTYLRVWGDSAKFWGMGGFQFFPSNLGQTNLAQFGDWVLPAGHMVHDVAIFYPPATGDMGQQRAEAETLALVGYASLLYSPPYIRDTSETGGFGDPHGTRRLWIKAREEFPELISAIKARFGPHLRIVVSGKNLGGSVAAYACNDSVERLIVSGSVPILSAFWATSLHSVAIRSRQGFTQMQIDVFVRATREFDLIESASRLPQQTLIQFGTRDPWIETEGFREFSRKIVKPKTVQWTDDDHAMAAGPSVDSRKYYLTRP